jgi:site-specific DNA recombinase
MYLFSHPKTAPPPFFQYIEKIRLSCIFCQGKFKNYKGEEYEASHPPLISKQLFARVQAVLNQKTRVINKTVDKFTFTGLMKCGECGASITAELQKGHVYYRCTKKVTACTQKYLREEALLEKINNAILKVFVDNETKDKIVNRFEELAQEESKASSSLAR